MSPASKLLNFLETIYFNSGYNLFIFFIVFTDQRYNKYLLKGTYKYYADMHTINKINPTRVKN